MFSITKVSHTSLFGLLWISGNTGLNGVKWSSILSKHGHGDSRWDKNLHENQAILPTFSPPLHYEHDPPHPSAQGCDPA